MREVKPLQSIECNTIEFILTHCQKNSELGFDEYILQFITHESECVFFNHDTPTTTFVTCIHPLKIKEILLKLGYVVNYTQDTVGTELLTVSWKQPEYLKLYESAY